jgi:spermidine/putrescine transport system permease protein
VVSNFNSGTTVTFPLYIFGAAQRGIPVEVNVIATMLFAGTVGAMLFTVWQQRRAERLAAVRPEQEGEPLTGAGALAAGTARG